MPQLAAAGRCSPTSCLLCALARLGTWTPGARDGCPRRRCAEHDVCPHSCFVTIKGGGRRAAAGSRRPAGGGGGCSAAGKTQGQRRVGPAAAAGKAWPQRIRCPSGLGPGVRLAPARRFAVSPFSERSPGPRGLEAPAQRPAAAPPAPAQHQRRRHTTTWRGRSNPLLPPPPPTGRSGSGQAQAATRLSQMLHDTGVGDGARDGWPAIRPGAYKPCPRSDPTASYLKSISLASQMRVARQQAGWRRGTALVLVTRLVVPPAVPSRTCM